MNNATITYSDDIKGWTSFHSFYPDFMLGMNNNFFSFYNGNLFIHHSDLATRNTYYGTRYPSKISMMINENPSDIKSLKAISLEGNRSWNALITAFVSNVDEANYSKIDEVEFTQKEGIWYAYARRNEDSKQIDSKSAYGIGRVLGVDLINNELTINGFSDTAVVGDTLVRGSDMTVIGEITSIVRNNEQTIMNVSSVEDVNEDEFIVGCKNARIEGGSLRGYTMRIDLETNKLDKVELFALNAEVFKSFP